MPDPLKYDPFDPKDHLPRPKAKLPYKVRTIAEMFEGMRRRKAAEEVARRLGLDKSGYTIALEKAKERLDAESQPGGLSQPSTEKKHHNHWKRAGLVVWGFVSEDLPGTKHLIHFIREGGRDMKAAGWSFLFASCALAAAATLLVEHEILPQFTGTSSPSTKTKIEADNLVSPTPAVIPPIPTPDRSPPLPTLHQLFETDFSSLDSQYKKEGINFGIGKMDIESALLMNVEEHSEFLAFYVPLSTDGDKICSAIMKSLDRIRSELEPKASMVSKKPGEDPKTYNGLKFTGEVFIYTENFDDGNLMVKWNLERLQGTCRDQGIELNFRGTEYQQAKGLERRAKP